MKNEVQYLVLVREGATKSKTWYNFSEGNLAKYAKALRKKKNRTVGLAIPLLKIYPQEVLYIYKYSGTKLFIVKMLNILVTIPRCD